MSKDCCCSTCCSCLSRLTRSNSSSTQYTRVNAQSSATQPLAASKWKDVQTRWMFVCLALVLVCLSILDVWDVASHGCFNSEEFFITAWNDAATSAGMIAFACLCILEATKVTNPLQVRYSDIDGCLCGLGCYAILLPAMMDCLRLAFQMKPPVQFLGECNMTSTIRLTVLGCAVSALLISLLGVVAMELIAACKRGGPLLCPCWYETISEHHLDEEVEDIMLKSL